MMYIVKAYEDEQCFEYEYGLIDHAKEHLDNETCYAELFAYQSGREILIETNLRIRKTHGEE